MPDNPQELKHSNLTGSFTTYNNVSGLVVVDQQPYSAILIVLKLKLNLSLGFKEVLD